MAEREIPLSVFHFDCFWMREFRWCDFEWDPITFPEPEAMLARLKAKGLRICVWINPYIAQRSALFEEGRAKGYLVTRADGTVWQWDKWQAGMALVDFTNPAAAQWFSSHLERLLDQGVDAFKTDFGERIPTDVTWFDGSDPERMHNYYTHLYNRTVFDLLERRRGTGEAVLFARSATAGGQQYPVHWGGDCDSTYESMAETLRGGLSLAASGFGYWSHDIGGFEGTPDAGVFKRWLAFGLLSSHSRLHGSGSYRVPWAFDEEAVEIARKFTRLKMSLMPYLAAASQAGTGPRHPDAAADGAGVPRRSGHRARRHPVHARRLAAGRSGVHRRRHGAVLRPGGNLDQPAGRDCRHRPAVGHPAARVRFAAAAGASRFRHPDRRPGRASPTTTTPTASRCTCSASRRSPARTCSCRPSAGRRRTTPGSR